MSEEREQLEPTDAGYIAKKMMEAYQSGDDRRLEYLASLEGMTLAHVKAMLDSQSSGMDAATLEGACGLAKLIEDTISGKRKNIAWPWPMLTKYARALLPGTLTLLCGAGGSTKSMMLSEACLYWIDHKIPFAVFHLEEDREYHLNRALVQLEGNSELVDDDWVRENPDITQDAYTRHKTTLDRLAACVWDAPDKSIDLIAVASWIEQRAKEGRRIIAVDPITAADNTDQPWIADRNFVNRTKAVMRKYGASLVVITHPKSSTHKGSQLDNMAGGQSYNRFSQAVFQLNSIREIEDRSIRVKVSGQWINATAPVNRMLFVAKSRNGPAGGMELGYLFDRQTFRFQEQGVLVNEQ